MPNNSACKTTQKFCPEAGPCITVYPRVFAACLRVNAVYHRVSPFAAGGQNDKDIFFPETRQHITVYPHFLPIREAGDRVSPYPRVFDLIRRITVHLYVYSTSPERPSTVYHHVLACIRLLQEAEYRVSACIRPLQHPITMYHRVSLLLLCRC